VAANPGQFPEALQNNSTFFLSEHQSLNEVPHKSFKRPGGLSFLPTWFFAYDYPHNVNNFGVPIAGCEEKKYCNHLPVPVFPTPLYEVVVGLLLFGLLWAVRKKLKVPGTLFALYLMLNGLERFFVEKIRVNTRMNFFGFHPTQAEVISTLLFLTGLLLWIVLKRKAGREKSTA
jgi:prolipoprotein diacylglyceryltransferase